MFSSKLSEYCFVKIYSQAKKIWGGNIESRYNHKKSSLSFLLVLCLNLLLFYLYLSDKKRLMDFSFPTYAMSDYSIDFWAPRKSAIISGRWWWNRKLKQDKSEVFALQKTQLSLCFLSEFQVLMAVNFANSGNKALRFFKMNSCAKNA